MQCLEYSSPSRARSVLANDQAIKWAKPKVLVYADSVLCLGQMRDTQGAIEGKVNWKDSGCIRLAKMQWESMEKQLNPSGKISQDFHRCLFFKRSSTAVNWQTRKWSNFKKSQALAWMIIISSRKISNQLENCLKFAHKLSWNASTWHELDDLTFCGRSTSLQGQSQNGFWHATDDWRG